MRKTEKREFCVKNKNSLPESKFPLKLWRKQLLFMVEEHFRAKYVFKTFKSTNMLTQS